MQVKELPDWGKQAERMDFHWGVLGGKENKYHNEKHIPSSVLDG